nr:hypothetical protein [Asanoa ishikariensis]
MASTSRIAVAWVAAARSWGTTPIRLATAHPGPRTSTGLPLDRGPAPRSTSVTAKPWRASQ